MGKYTEAMALCVNELKVQWTTTRAVVVPTAVQHLGGRGGRIGRSLRQLVYIAKST